MTQAPRWRYARKTVPLIEKVIALMVLLVPLGVAGLFLRDMHGPKAPSPLSVDPKLIAEAAQSTDAIVAGYLLPVTTLARRTSAPLDVPLQELAGSNPDLAATARDYKPKRVFTAAYQVAGLPISTAVLDCQSPERGLDLWTARKPAQARTMPIGGAGQAWRTDSRAAFSAGKYYVEAWADPSQVAPASQPASAAAGAQGAPANPLATLLTELSRSHVFSKPVTGTEAPARQTAGGDQAGPLPRMVGPDLAGPGETRRFNPDTLYEKIDGKAQLYLSYGFAELLFTTYTAGDVSLDVYVYDMGQADNAFGIFKAEEGESAESAAIGRGGYYSGSSLFFWKGKYYVNVLAAEGGESNQTTEREGMAGDQARPIALRLATAIANQLQDAGQSLWAEQVLPADGKVPGSFEFRKSDAFGLDFLKDVFSAQYKHDGKDLTLFVTRAASPQAAQDLLKQYQEFTAKYGKVIDSVEVVGSRVLVAENTGTYDAVFAKDSYFGGITAADDKDLAKDVATKWLQGMTR